METISILYTFLKRYILQDLLAAAGKFSCDDSSVEGDFKKLFSNAISLSVAPVSATMAEVVPVCGGVLTVPHCDLCSSLTERPCTDGYKRSFYLIKCWTAVAVNLRFQNCFENSTSFMQFILFYAIYCVQGAELWKVISRETKVVQNEHQSQSKISLYS